ncbi:hypothetical protein PPSIR1_18752 [Plesiocystis pacifica SIR-1]|uniref:IgGFc-binding protein N-terminal domain-containing protein n=1 Tax=Plesiocystis pacifica SIR-1 TaxID=391625 RepID=A6GBG6_9BACT|nr:IgGFc-binding protein [Plesiocystis pacifica]EDM76770.1 hypothetical protein PPSIR1_18752 [Plesiocystis pacifica SIR-1]
MSACADDTTNTTAGDENSDITGDGIEDTETTNGNEEVGTDDATSSTDADTTDADTTADTSTDADTTADTTDADTSTDADTTDADTTADTGTEESTEETTDEGTFCDPGETICFDPDNTQTCVEDGSMFGDPVPCEPDTTCIGGECVSECDLIEANPSSVGCSFFATKLDNFYNNSNNPAQNDSLIVGNISSTDLVVAQLYYVPVGGGAEQPEGPPVNIPAEGTYTWSLGQVEIDSVTTIRQGGVYRVETSRPVVAYLHSPIGSTATNDASMLLPEHALTGNYVVTSYPNTLNTAYPSYFTAIGIVDGTTVDFTVTDATQGGGGVAALSAGGSTSVALDRYSTLNVVVQQTTGGDVSGTVISADQPIWLVGATECANVPAWPANTYCDHMEEAPFPLEYWGQEYVGAHAPTRGNEAYHWRIYGGEDGITVNTTPTQPGFPITLDKGEFYSFSTQDHFVISGDGPFLPVQYLESENPNANTGDPGMYQMVPTEQFLSSYAFVTGEGYNVHYAQITRPAGGADVFIDGNLVGGYTTVGAFEVADVNVSEGAHFATSDAPFGVVQVGYTGVTSYAYPGGLKLEIINPQ